MTRYEHDCFFAPTNWQVRLILGVILIAWGLVVSHLDVSAIYSNAVIIAGGVALFLGFSCAENRAHNKRFAEDWKARFIHVPHQPRSRREAARRARLKAMNAYQQAYLAWAFADFKGRPEDFLFADTTELLRKGDAYDSAD